MNDILRVVAAQHGHAPKVTNSDTGGEAFLSCACGWAPSATVWYFDTSAALEDWADHALWEIAVSQQAQ